MDLSNSPDTTWVSPPIGRAGTCCGGTGSNCVEFNVTISEYAVGINFIIASGATPSGSLTYQVDCGGPTNIGVPICLTGPGTYVVTFCKAGANINKFGIISIPGPYAMPGTGYSTPVCAENMDIIGMTPGTISITDITGGGIYESYLSCTDCLNPEILCADFCPSFVDYEFCGDIVTNTCFPDVHTCDTFRVYFLDSLKAELNHNPGIICHGDAGVMMEVTASGGKTPYTYEWYDQPGGTGNIVSTNDDYFATVAGNYSVVVYDSLYPKCNPVTIDFDVIEPALNTSVSPVNPYICDANTVELYATGADFYQWSPPDGLSATTGAIVQAAPDVTTTYTIIGTDIYGCVDDPVNVTVEVCVPSDPWIENNDTTICEGNSVNLAADGALYYEWTPHDGLDDPYSQYPVATPNITTTYYLTGYGESCNLIYNGDFSGGYDGFYTLYNYSPNLIPEGNFYIGDNPSNYHYNFASCADHTTGSGNMMIVNGSPVANEEIWCQDIIVLPNTDYVFSTWLTSAHFSNPAVLQFSINGTLLGSPFPATSTSCEWNQFYATWNSGANTNITICIVNQNTIADGNDFAIDDIYFSPICPNYGADSVKITVNPNPTPVLPPNTNACSYNLPYTLDVGNGYSDYAWNTGATTQTIDVNTTGNYSVTVTDGNGCTNETSSSFVVNPIPDITTVVSSDYNGQDISCYGFTDGTAEVQHNSGTPPYLYQWDSPAGNQTTQEATNLGPGTYYVTITDGNGCTIEDNISLVEPPQLDATTAVTSDYNGQDVSCNGFTDGSAEAIPMDGTPPYTYLWDASAGNQTTAEATNLGAGTFYVTITDVNGCSIVRDVSLIEPPQLDATTAVTSDYNGQDVSCNGFTDGSAEAIPTDGTPPYTYLWDASTGNQTTQEATNLGAGTYYVTITDINGCSIVRDISLVDPPQLDATTAVTSNYNGQDISCNGFNDGSAEAIPIDGTPPYTYLWDASTGNQTTQEATNLGAGTFYVTITDV
ncbi:MAG: SprB repeat-containing protein, partial [Candidatus Cloacimonetes bacterium]|nr:SprB repeat-containing protein [Candidatus Cloacimonadota bacterium]